MNATATRPGGRWIMRDRAVTEPEPVEETPATAMLWTFLSWPELEALLRFRNELVKA